MQVHGPHKNFLNNWLIGTSVHGKKKYAIGHMNQLLRKAAGPQQTLPVHALDQNNVKHKHIWQGNCVEDVVKIKVLVQKWQLVKKYLIICWFVHIMNNKVGCFNQFVLRE